MNISTRLIGPCATFPQGSPESIRVDVGAVVRRLLLFQTYFVESYRLLEIPRLISAFGPSGLITLLQSGALKIQCEVVTVAQTGQSSLTQKRRRHGPLPLGSFELGVVKSGDPEKYLHDSLQIVHEIEGLPFKEAKRVKKEIVNALANSPPSSGADTMAATRADLSRPDFLRPAIVQAASNLEGATLSLRDLSARVIAIDEDEYRVESNLRTVAGLTEEKTHQVLQNALLAVANVNLRIEAMRHHNAISGVVGEEVSLFAQKLDFLLRDVAPQNQERRFDRVIEVAGLPDVSTETDNHRVDVDKLLKVRDSRDCAEFRDWLQRIDSLTNAEIAPMVQGFKVALNGLIQSTGGKAIRLLANSALGLIPGYGTVASLVTGALDTFVVGEVFTQSGPASFVSSQYTSLFL